jgi:diacylglycerol kinase (ATP)
MKNPHILFVINPKSGGTDKAGLDKLIEKQCKKHNYTFDLLFTRGRDDLALIKNTIGEKVPGIVVACGGDGTINLVAKALLGADISLGIMPLGSANGLAHEFRIPEDEIDSLSIIFNEKPKLLDILSINGDKVSLHLSDVGFNAKVIKEFERDQGRGKLG